MACISPKGSKPKWIIHYWMTTSPGRAEFARFLLEELGEDYEVVTEKCVGFFRNDAPAKYGKCGFPCFAPPLLRHGDLQLSQIPIICRYIASKFGLMPKMEADIWHAEQVNASVHDYIAEGRLAFHGINPTGSYYPQAKETQPYIDRFTADRFPMWLKHFEAVLDSNNGGKGFLFGDSLTYVDLALFHAIRASEAQFPEAWTSIKPYIPLLLAFKDRIANRPNIKAFLESDRSKPFEGNIQPKKYLMKVDIEKIQKALNENVNFIKQYHNIGKCHMVEFITADQWGRLISLQGQNEIKQYFANSEAPKQGHSEVPTDEFCITNFNVFKQESSRLSVAKCDFVSTIDELLTNEFNGQSGAVPEVAISSHEFMCTKKSHEVKYMSQLIVALAKLFGINSVLDIGSGKGYLGSYLSLSYGLHVTGIDCSDENSKNALTRAHKFTTYWKKLLKNKTDTVQNMSVQFDSQLQFVPKTAFINSDNDLQAFIHDKDICDDNKASDVVICGLHACGDLSSSILRTFIANEPCKVACVVGCCYHHLTEDGAENTCGFPMSKYIKSKKYLFGRNTLMLSLRALEKTAAKNKEEHDKSERSLFYRAVLTLILQEKFGIPGTSKEVRIGGIFRKCNGFVDYIHRAMKCIKLTKEQQASISDEEIMSFHDENLHHFEEIKCFNMLRSMFGSVVEHTILLDRMLYLFESGISNAHLVKLFDPVLSPRCYAIVAWK